MTKVEEKSFMKNKTKYLITTFIMVLSFMLVGFTNVNAATTTAEVNNYSDLTDKMSDNVTDVVKLTSDITLDENSDTRFDIEMSKTLDFNGFTLTVPEHRRLKLIYNNTLDLKFINSNSSKRAKLNLLSDTGYTPIYNEIKQAEHIVNFEMDGVDVEYIKDFDSFWQTVGTYRFNNVVFKNLKVTGFYEMVDTRAYKTTKFSNVTKESKKGPSQTFLIKSSSLTVNDVIDANAVVEYYSTDGVMTADRAAALDSINTYRGPITVKFVKGFKVSNVELNGVYGETPEANISIKNVGENALQVKSVTVSDTDKFEIIGSTQPTVNAGATNTDFKVKAKSGLNAGEYTATITVTDVTNEKYTATVTLKVNDDKVITEIRLTGGYQYGNVPAGILPAFNPGTTNDNISIDIYNSDWSYFMSDVSTWSRFGDDTPVAYNDGNTKYGYDFNVKTNAGYELAPNSNLKVFYNEGEVTSTVAVRRYAWGAYVTVDLGKAIGENPTSYTVTFNSNGGTEIAPKEVVSGLKIKEPETPTKDKYVFRGWYEDDAFNTKFDFNTPITSDITLYAKWEAANTIDEIRLTGDYGYGNVPAGTLPAFNPGTTTDNISIGLTGSDWEYFRSDISTWSGFGSETPVAYNDGKTKYGYRFQVKTNDGYQLNSTNLKVFYNGNDVTSTVAVNRWAWGAYVTVDLGKATGGTPTVSAMTVSDVTLTGIYGETPEANISIQNVGDVNLQVISVTVSDTDKFEIIGSTQPTIDVGATNTDFKVKAKTGLNAGEYTATITVADANNETYTATATLNVSKKELTGLGISFDPNTWKYGETAQTPTITGVEELTTEEYKVTYSKETGENLGETQPTLVGKYKATLSVTSTNYSANDVTTTFEIKPNPRSVLVSTEQELIEAVKGVDPAIYEVKLANNITLTKFLNFYVVNDITLELNGQTLDIGSNGLSFSYGQSDYDETNNEYYYNFNSKLTIKDSSSSKTGKILSKQNIFFNYYDTNHDGEIKKFGLTIDGGYYEMISSSPNFFDFFSRDYETNGKNLTVDVKVKDAVFKLNDGMYLFGTISNSDSDIKLNFNFESLKVLGLTSKLGSLKLGEMKLDDVIDPNSKAYFQKLPYTTGAPVLEEADRNTLVGNFYATGGSDPYIIIKKVNGFEITNVEISETYNETPSPKDISIKNISENALEVKSVTVDSSNFIVEGPSTQQTVGAGATNTDFKVKANTGLNAGEYTATITVTDANGETYIATVTLKVEPKQLTGVGIDLASTWVYKETKTPTLIGVEGLTPDDYAITYSKKDNSENYGKIMPKLVGKYKATLSITNPNYTASEASVDFEITPITTEVKVKSYDETFTYDGSEHTKNAYDVLWANNASSVTGNILPNGDKVTAVITGKVKDVKDTAPENNTIGEITITNADGDDVTSCYSNKVKAAGKLTVTKKDSKITVTSEDANKPYDGNPLTNNNKTVTGEIVAGEEVVVEFTGSQLYVGISDNEFTVKVMRGSDDVTDNYTFGTHTFGKLTVTSAEQPLAIADQYVKVNGSILLSDLEQSVIGNVGNIDFAIKSGAALTYNATNEEYVAGATAGDVVMTVTAAKMDLGGDGTPEWKETSKDFTIHVINKTDVNITGLNNNEEFTYDGNPKMPTGTISVDAGTINVSDLEVKYEGTGSTTYNSATAPTNVGTYKVTYKVPEDNTSYVGTYSVEFSIKKAGLDKVTLVKDTFEYTGTDITPTLNNVNDKIEISGITTAKNVSNNTITAKIKDISNYEWKDATTTDLVLNWSITQATPDYTVPTGLTGVKGETLNDVTLPDRFTWNDTTVVLTAGTNTYKATYTPVDTTNYKTITDIDIKVNVKDKFNVITSVNGGNGTITPSKIGVIEGTKEEITFTPNSGYVVSKVMVNGVEKTSEVRNNKIEITVTEEMTVEVTYKRKYTGGGGGSTTTTKYKITVTEGKNGSITPNGVVKVEKGEDQTFKIKAEKGYEIADVLVDGKSVGAVAKYTFKNVKAKHTIEATFKKVEMPEQKPEEKETFKDVKKNDWYYEAVEYVANKGLMNGTGNDEFTPDANTTRGMIVTILYRLEGSPEVSMSTFTDVANTEYYAKAVAWAEKNGIVNGYGEGKFGPNDVITREQLAAIMYRYSNYKKYDTSVGEDTNILSYNDISELSEYAVSSMQWACGAGLVNGIGDGKLAPKGNATRAQLATILMRYCESNK